jgi:hypothetical protein
VLLAAVWIGSRWSYVGYASQGGACWVSVSAGTVVIEHVTTGVWPNPPTRWNVLLQQPHLAWWFGRKSGPWGWSVGVPLWVPTVPLLLATGAAWRLDALARRRARAGCCAKCGYDLRGLRDGAVCPECGGPAPPRVSGEAAASPPTPGTPTAEGEP